MGSIYLRELAAMPQEITMLLDFFEMEDEKELPLT